MGMRLLPLQRRSVVMCDTSPLLQVSQQLVDLRDFFFWFRFLICAAVCFTESEAGAALLPVHLSQTKSSHKAQD